MTWAFLLLLLWAVFFIVFWKGRETIEEIQREIARLGREIEALKASGSGAPKN
jgi:hypothetical protein